MSLLLPFMVSRGAPVFSAIFHGALSPAYDFSQDVSGGAQKATWRNVIKPPGGFAKGGTKLRFVISADLTGWANDVGTAIDHIGVGIWSGGGANTNATPVPVTTGGLAYWHTQAPFTVLQSDEISLPFAATDGLVVIIDTASNTHSGMAGGSPGSNPGCSAWYKSGAASYNLATVTGYTQLPIASPSLPQGLLGVLNIGAK
jgi:hypothetical protein